MSALPATPGDIRRRRPEWSPWLAVVEAVVREIGATPWDTAVPDRDRVRAAAGPLVGGAEIAVPRLVVRRLLGRLVRTASDSGAPKMAALRRALEPAPDVLALFAASVRQDGAPAARAAADTDADPEAFAAVVALLAVPFLHACRRRWSASVPESWVEGYCPVCASWPAFTEVRGIERSRHHRCGRCGGDWHARLLRCPYCATADHDGLVTLAPEAGGSHATIDACRRCHGYVKTFTRLQGCAPEAVLFEDMASVDLDLAALGQGFARPAGAARAFDVAVSDNGSPRRFLAWRT